MKIKYSIILSLLLFIQSFTIVMANEIEQKEINNSNFVVNIPVNQRSFFLMIGLSDGKIYTEKIGLQ